MKFLWDTNTAIYSIAGVVLPLSAIEKLHLLSIEGINISQITKIELLGFRFPNPEMKKITLDFVGAAKIYNISPEVEQATIGLRIIRKIKTPDAIIAATALVHDLELITGNVSDFKSLPGLKVSNPFEW